MPQDDEAVVHESNEWGIELDGGAEIDAAASVALAASDLAVGGLEYEYERPATDLAVQAAQGAVGTAHASAADVSIEELMKQLQSVQSS